MFCYLFVKLLPYWKLCFFGVVSQFYDVYNVIDKKCGKRYLFSTLLLLVQ